MISLFRNDAFTTNGASVLLLQPGLDATEVEPVRTRQLSDFLADFYSHLTNGAWSIALLCKVFFGYFSPRQCIDGFGRRGRGGVRGSILGHELRHNPVKGSLVVDIVSRVGARIHCTGTHKMSEDGGKIAITTSCTPNTGYRAQHRGKHPVSMVSVGDRAVMGNSKIPINVARGHRTALWTVAGCVERRGLHGEGVVGT